MKTEDAFQEEIDDEQLSDEPQEERDVEHRTEAGDFVREDSRTEREIGEEQQRIQKVLLTGFEPERPVHEPHPYVTPQSHEQIRDHAFKQHQYRVADGSDPVQYDPVLQIEGDHPEHVGDHEGDDGGQVGRSESSPESVAYERCPGIRVVVVTLVTENVGQSIGDLFSEGVRVVKLLSRRRQEQSGQQQDGEDGQQDRPRQRVPPRGLVQRFFVMVSLVCDRGVVSNGLTQFVDLVVCVVLSLSLVFSKGYLLHISPLCCSLLLLL